MEISGPPQFLNNSVEDQGSARDGVVHHRGRKKSRDKKDLPAGIVPIWISSLVFSPHGV